jgi:hypothetical protein
MMVPTERATFDELVHILRRLDLWTDLFEAAATHAASLTLNTLQELTVGEDFKLFARLQEDSLEQFERLLMYEADPVHLWRVSRGLENYKFALLETVEKRFPERARELGRFHMHA